MGCEKSAQGSTNRCFAHRGGNSASSTYFSSLSGRGGGRCKRNEDIIRERVAKRNGISDSSSSSSSLSGGNTIVATATVVLLRALRHVLFTTVPPEDATWGGGKRRRFRQWQQQQQRWNLGLLARVPMATTAIAVHVGYRPVGLELKIVCRKGCALFKTEGGGPYLGVWFGCDLSI